MELGIFFSECGKKYFKGTDLLILTGGMRDCFKIEVGFIRKPFSHLTSPCERGETLLDPGGGKIREPGHQLGRVVPSPIKLTQG